MTPTFNRFWLRQHSGRSPELCCREAPSFGSLSGPGVPSRPEPDARSPRRRPHRWTGLTFSNQHVSPPSSVLYEVTHESPVLASEPLSSSLGDILLACPQPRRWKSNSAMCLGKATAGTVAASGFARDVAEKTGGRVKINVYPSSQLGSEKDMVEGLQIGSQQAGLIGSGSFQPIEPKLGIVELPYAWPTREHAYRAFDGELGAALANLLEAKNIVTLAWWENGFRHITTKGEPVRTPADLKGLKIRVTPDKMRLDTFRALGAEPGAARFRRALLGVAAGRLPGPGEPARDHLSRPRSSRCRSRPSLTGHVWGAACLVILEGGLEPHFSRRPAGDQDRARSSGARSSAR